MPNLVPFDLEKIKRARANAKDDDKARAYLADCKYTAKRDKLYLSQLLGYDFQPDVHTDLFNQYIPFDESKDLFDQSQVKHRLTLWSRGFFKTTSIIVEIAQLILNFPDVSIMLMQSTVQNTKELLKEVKGHFDKSNINSNLDLLFPGFCKEKLGSAAQFTVPARTRARKDPTVFVASPKAVKAGKHPDVGFFDDLVTEVNYKNPELMKKVIKDFGHFTPLINPGGYFYVTGTRYTFGDLYEHIIRTNDGRWQITVRGCWRTENGKLVSNFPPRRLPSGKPIGLSVEDLLAIQRQDPETFSAQYLNQPIAAGKQLFTEALLNTALVSRSGNQQVGPAILIVDLASSNDPASDKRTVLAARQINGCPTVCELRSGVWPTYQTAVHILEMCVTHRPLKVLVEGQAAIHFVEYLKLIAKDKNLTVPAEVIKMSNQKAAKHLRISAIEGAIRTNRCKFLVGLACWPELVTMFTQYPKGRHDDEIDTVGLMVQFYAGQLLFEQTPAANLPFFLLRPGQDYGLETKITNDDNGLVIAPEVIL